MNIDLTVTKIERNTRFAHLSTDLRRYQTLPVNEIISELDSALCFGTPFDVNAFLVLLYQIVAHQTYHIELDERSGMTYASISNALHKGEGNPRLEKLENILNAVGASLALCKISERESNIPLEELQRACFFIQDVGKDRYPTRETAELISHFGLHFRIFSFEDVKKRNVLTHSVDLSHPSSETITLKAWMNDVISIQLLLQLFNIDFSVELNIRPPIAEPE